MDQRLAGADIRREFSRFSAAGAVGFAVDATLFFLLNGWYYWSIAAARMVSASSAIVTTWALNRRFTFAARRSRGLTAELARYTLVQTAGLLVNLGAFALAIWLVPSLRAAPIIALGLGAAAALLFNFAAARTLAFVRRPVPPPGRPTD
jgi:putative flippase GtrA